MGFRSITFFIKLIQGPWLLTVSFDGNLDGDGRDNDGDGKIDEPARSGRIPTSRAPTPRWSRCRWMRRSNS
jgi:hypothetical protein